MACDLGWAANTWGAAVWGGWVHWPPWPIALPFTGPFFRSPQSWIAALAGTLPILLLLLRAASYFLWQQQEEKRLCSERKRAQELREMAWSAIKQERITRGSWSWEFIWTQLIGQSPKASRLSPHHSWVVFKVYFLENSLTCNSSLFYLLIFQWSSWRKSVSSRSPRDPGMSFCPCFKSLDASSLFIPLQGGELSSMRLVKSLWHFLWIWIYNCLCLNSFHT